MVKPRVKVNRYIRIGWTSFKFYLSPNCRWLSKAFFLHQLKMMLIMSRLTYGFVFIHDLSPFE